MQENEATPFDVDFAVCKTIFEMLDFLYQKSFTFLRDKASIRCMAVLSLDFDTFIYTFTAIYKSLEIHCKPLLFYSFHNSVPVKN